MLTNKTLVAHPKDAYHGKLSKGLVCLTRQFWQRKTAPNPCLMANQNGPDTRLQSRRGLTMTKGKFAMAGRTVSRANRNKKLAGRSWVYFAQERTGLVKIGQTRLVSTRMRALNSSTPGGIVFLGKMPEMDLSESMIHRFFWKFRVHGEWFKPVPLLLQLAASSARAWPGDYRDAVEDDQYSVLLAYLRLGSIYHIDTDGEVFLPDPSPTKGCLRHE